MVGGVIGNYRILRRIGEGGMGAVYVAEHALIGRQAAIKVLLREMSWRQDLVTRFFNEARAATAVKHPGIVEIYDFGYHTDGSAYIVMEYLEGESLSVRLQRTGTLSEARASALCRQVAGALGAAHAKGIVHRDLKPDNIYIVRDPDVADGERTKILDFGIAKLTTGDVPGQSVTRTGSVMGTPPYMSPEQCKGARAVDHRADLYALGCILFEMMCGRPPFVADGSGEIMAQHIYAPVPRPSSIAAVTPQIEEVILRALVKEPSQRFQSANEMIAALRSAVPSGVLHAGMAEPGTGAASESAPAWPTPPRPTPSEPMSSGPMSSALPQPAAMIAIGPQLTTLSQASASAFVATGAGNRRRAWQLPAVATVAIAIGAVTITLGVRRGERDAPTAAAPEPAPTAAPASTAPPRRPGPPPTSDPTSGRTSVAAPSQPSLPTPAASPAPAATHVPEAATPSTPAGTPAPPPPSGDRGTQIAAVQGMHPWIRGAAAAIASAGLVTTTGCAAEWPRRAIAISASSVARQDLDIATVDVLPIDLQAWGDRDADGELAEARSTGEADILHAVLDTLAARHYKVGALIDWNGQFQGRSAMPREDLIETIGSLAHYGEATEDSPGRLPVPYLPAKLGTTTGADATLYVGGWAYVGRPAPSTAEQVGKGILIGLAIVTVVAIAVILAEHHPRHHRDHRHRSSHSRGRTASDRGGIAPRGSSVSATGGSAAISSGRDDNGVRNADLHPGGLHRRPGGVDAFGHVAIDVEPSAPDWSEDDALPHEGEQSQMYLELTLIDNRSGLAVWHAHQTFPARMTSRDDTARVMRTLLAPLPAHAPTAPH